jgi:basic amino acid/polyamine antiporter, APA family
MNDSQRGAGPEVNLVRAIGVFVLAAAVINVIVGGGIFRLPASIATQLGNAAPLAFVVGALAIIPTTLCFAAAGSRIQSTGGPYAYVSAAFGPFAGFLTGAMLWVCNIGSSAGIAVALSDQVARVFPDVSVGVARAGVLIALYGVLIALNAFGVKLGSRAIVVLATLKLTPLFILAAVGVFFIDWNQVELWTIPSVAALGNAMVMVIFAYSGIETALSPSGEVRDPARDVPRAALAATLVVVLLYVTIQLVAQGVLGPALPGNTAPLAATAGALWKPGFVILLVTASISMFGFMMGNLLGSSRVVYALGRDGHLPTFLGRVTATHHVPLIAVFLHGIVACAFAILGSFDWLVRVSAGANCLLYIAVSLAAWQLTRTDRKTGFSMPGGAVLVPLLSCIAMGWIVSRLAPDEWQAIAWGMVILIGIYGVRRVMARVATKA